MLLTYTFRTMVNIGRRTLDTHRYVADPRSAGSDFLTCESISDRRHIHLWRVQPHHHDGVLQLFLFNAGSLRIEIDGQARRVGTPAFLLVPPLHVHGFDFDPDVDGWVIAVPMNRLAALLGEDDDLRALLTAPMMVGGDLETTSATQASFSRLESFFALLVEISRSQRHQRDLAMRSIFGAIVATLADEWPPGAPSDPRSGPKTIAALQTRAGVGLIETFRTLVARHCRVHRSIASYASELGVSPTHLSRMCSALTGRPALALVHAQLLIEAQRELAYSAQPIEVIADRLGFSAASYFTRFFSRMSGQTPSAFRRTLRSAPPH